MKILHVFKTYLPDSFTGIERVIWEIAEGTAELGVETDVFALSRTPARGALAMGHHRVHQARQHVYWASTGISLSAVSHFARLAAAADIVHYHFPWPMMDLLHFAARHGRPTVVTYHSDVVRQAWLARLYRPLMTRFLSSVDRIVATSPNYLASSAVLQQFCPHAEVIPIGLGARHEPEPATISKWRARVGDRFILFVGALRYYKGIFDLIEAARLSGLPLVILGQGDMRQEIERANLSNVTLIGPQADADKEALLSLCTAFVLPSHLRSEAYGVALAEAARAARPMISCDIGTGTSYVNRDGETGFVVPPNDPVRLAAAMRDIWDNPELAERMGQAAGRHFARHMTAGAMAASYRQLYARLLGTGG